MPGKPGGAPAVQIFGRRDSRDTQKALRFFKERRVPVTFVDLAVRPLAATELRRFVERLGAEVLLDRDGRRYREHGIAYLRVEAGELTERLLADQALLRLPLVRAGSLFSVGVDEPAWRTFVTGAGANPAPTAGVSTERSRTS